MTRFHAGGNTTALLSLDEQAEQEQLIDAEWNAATSKSALGAGTTSLEVRAK